MFNPVAVIQIELKPARIVNYICLSNYNYFVLEIQMSPIYIPTYMNDAIIQTLTLSLPQGPVL